MTKKSIKFNNACFGYYKRPLCLVDLNFELTSGRIYTLLGIEGSGKTSLLRLLSGLENQYAGSILLNGKELSTLGLKDRNISYLPSEPVVLLNKSIKQNIDYLCAVENKDLLSEQELQFIMQKFMLNLNANLKLKKLSDEDLVVFTLMRSYIKNAKTVLIDDILVKKSLFYSKKLKNALSLLLEDISDKIVVVVVANALSFDNYKQFGESKIIYLSFGKAYLFDKLGDIIKLPLDFGVSNYFESSIKDLYLTKTDSGYYLQEIVEQPINKKKQVVYDIIRQIKLDEFELYKEALNFDEKIKVKLVAFETIDFGKLSDSQINDKLKEGSLHLFDSMVNCKII